MENESRLTPLQGFFVGRDEKEKNKRLREFEYLGKILTSEMDECSFAIKKALFTNHGLNGLCLRSH